MRSFPSRLVLAIVVLWAAGARASDGGAGDAGAGSGEDRYYAAVDLEQAGDHAGAVAALVRLADELPGDRFAVFALDDAARIEEEQLDAPARALELYERLLRRYPDTRSAIHAGARAAVLRPNLSGGGEPWRELQAIRNGFATRPRAESIRRTEALLAGPDFPAAAEATLFLAGLEGDDGHAAKARTLYTRVTQRWPHAAEAPLAWEALGQLDIVAGDWTAARADFGALAAFANPDLDRVAADGLARVAREQWLTRLYWAALGFLAGFLLLHLALVASGGRAGRPQLLPFELLLYLPPAALFGAVSLTENPAIEQATLTIVLGGGAIVWLTANALRCRPPALRTWLARAVAHALAVVLAVSCLAFVAIHRAYLTQLIADTVSYGPDR